MASEIELAIPKIDFSALDSSSSPGTDAWNATRGQVMAALDSHGFFQAIYDKISPELREKAFNLGKGMMTLPTEIKQRSHSDLPFQGYFPRTEYLNFDILTVEQAELPGAVKRLATDIWPEGNLEFCDTVESFIRLICDLELMIRRMVTEGLGVEKHFDSMNKSTTTINKFNAWGTPPDQQTLLCLVEHFDVNFITIGCQQEVQGLELQTKTGQWLRAPPYSNCVILGQALKTWSNGRFEPTIHRVKNYETRYSISYQSMFKEGYLIEAPEELVDEEHPKLYKPYDYYDYVRYRFGDGLTLKNPLEVYCGINEVEPVGY